MNKTIDIVWKIEGGNITITKAQFTVFLHTEDTVKKLVTAIRRRNGKAHRDRFEFILDEEIPLDKFRAAIKAAKIDWDFVKEWFTWGQYLPNDKRVFQLNHIDQLQQAVLTKAIRL